MFRHATPRSGAPRRAFTLIELLIVVAIIAILAAIAVPNFLEAQTRAKVSRMKADMRSLATAIESYRVDNNDYAIPADEEGATIRFNAPPTEWFETRVSPLLTTPIAYMTARPLDIFAGEAAETPLIHYSTRTYVLRTEGSAEEFDELVGDMLGRQKNVHYYLLSHGPDKDHDFAATGHVHGAGLADHDDDHEDDHEEGAPTLYDPTNGTVSNGDVVYWGPGMGFLD
jgi:type II secretion system protein G